MRKNLIIVLIICTMLWLTACGGRTAEMPKDWGVPEADKNIAAEIILQEDPYFTVMDMGGSEYHYVIYNSDGETVKDGTILGRVPTISYIDDGTIQIYFSAGTNVYFCTYYDILHDRLSKQYESPLAAGYGMVAYLDRGIDAQEAVLVIEDLFKESGYHEEFYLEIPSVVPAVTDAIFIEGRLFCCLYQSQDLQEERFSILDLSDNSVMTGFSQRIYPTDPTLYDVKTEREYKEAFYAAITNQSVMEYQGGRAVYFRDYFQELYDLNDLSYLFLDCDGDGLPELVMDGLSGTFDLRSDEYCVLKYVPEEERVIFSYQMSSAMMLLGSSQWGSYKRDSYGESYTYWSMDANGVADAYIHFDHKEINIPGESSYYMGVSPVVYCIEQEQWEEFTQGLGAALEHPLEMVSFSEAFGEGFSPKMPDDGKGYYQWLYDYWDDFYDYWWERTLPFANKKTFKSIKSAYAEIAFQGEFEQGNPELQEEYKRGFMKLLRSELPFMDPETGKLCYLKDFFDLTGGNELDITRCKYIFFDADGDGTPELGIRNEDYRLEEYFFKYDAETESFTLWYAMIASWETWFGSRKLANPWGGAKDQDFIQLGENGETECHTHCLSDWYSDDVHLHMVMLPKYADEEQEVTVTKEMMAQGVFSRYDEQWYFRLTCEQYDEVTAAYIEAYYSAQKGIEEVTYSYEELFDEVQ